MHYRNLGILKGLVSVAWADGRLAEEELQVLEALLDAFDATPSERVELRAYAKTPRGLGDIPVGDLGYDDKRVLLQHAVLLTFIDGEQHDQEREMLRSLCACLEIEEGEAKVLMAAAEERAKQFLGQLS